MPVQTSYASEMEEAFEGQRANLGLVNILSKVAEGSDIPFGRAVVRGTGDGQALLPSTTGQAFLGVTEFTSAWAENGSNLHLYAQYREMNIINFGEVWVYTEQSVVPGDDVFFRHTADTAPLDVVGRFRKDTSGGDADQIVGATFETTTAAGGIAKIRINSPGLGVSVAPDSSETLTAAGAISLLTAITYFDSTAAAMAMTLADGVEGQKKLLQFNTDGGNVTVTPANFANGTAIVFTDALDYVELLFTDGAWVIIRDGNRAVVTITASGAIPLTAKIVYIDSTSGVQALTLADGAVGQQIIVKMLVDGGDSVITPANLLDGTTITFDDAGDSALLVFDGTNWGVIGTATATVA